MLAESHISIHTWPEKGMAVCDIFTCGEHTKPKKGVEYMQMMFNAEHINGDDIHNHLPDPCKPEIYMVACSGPEKTTYLNTYCVDSHGAFIFAGPDEFKI